MGQYQPTNVHVIGVPEGKRKIGRKNSLRNNDKFSNYDENYKFIEAQWTLEWDNQINSQYNYYNQIAENQW